MGQSLTDAVLCWHLDAKYNRNPAIAIKVAYDSGDSINDESQAVIVHVRIYAQRVSVTYRPTAVIDL